jgi:hypothetical protein
MKSSNFVNYVLESLEIPRHTRPSFHRVSGDITFWAIALKLIIVRVVNYFFHKARYNLGF